MNIKGAVDIQDLHSIMNDEALTNHAVSGFCMLILEEAQLKDQMALYSTECWQEVLKRGIGEENIIMKPIMETNQCWWHFFPMNTSWRAKIGIAYPWTLLVFDCNENT